MKAVRRCGSRAILSNGYNEETAVKAGRASMKVRYDKAVRAVAVDL